MKEVEKIFIRPEDSLEKTIHVIQAGGVGIALVVDEKQRLLGTITDGDVRRAILNKMPLHRGISSILDDHSLHNLQPTTVLVGTSCEQVLQIMKEKVIRHIPVLDEKGCVVELSLLSELINEDISMPLAAIVMAGGRGKRLHPLTLDTPKPMLLLNNRPLMEHTIEQLKKAGITKVNITTNYKSEMIRSHFGNGDRFGVEIEYINELQPLGTAGALGLFEIPDHPMLIINGDIITQLDFRAMYHFHRSHRAVMTVGVRKYDIKIPYGVIETEDIVIKNLIEKPLQTFIVNAGIYLIEPSVWRFIPKGRRFDMTELVETLIQENQRVISFPIQEYWLDVGHPEDYKQARIDAKNGKV